LSNKISLVKVLIFCVDRWLWVEDSNLSVLLVEAALASVHNTAEKTEFYQQLKRAEEVAKARKEKVNYHFLKLIDWNCN
jgi:staphylococcal nuclease domain-containing protein 1